MLVENMPQILAAAAGELRQANVTVLNGAEGLGELVAGLASQATSILDVVRSGNGRFAARVRGPAAGARRCRPAAARRRAADELSG